MSSIKVIGGEQLKGEIKIQGSKNAALPIIAAAILNKGITVLRNCPKIIDVFHMIKVLEELGCHTKWEGNTLIVDTVTLKTTTVPEESVIKMRSSILFLGALLGRSHEVKISYPGGCAIGERPINYHLNALKKMNITQEEIQEEPNMIYCFTNRIIGSDIFLEFPSVGATQNIILTAVLAEGITRIYNAAREPEVIELCSYLQEAGAKITGKGTAYIEIEGVKKLHNVEFTLSPDRIVAGTYMAAVAAVGGDVVFEHVPVTHLDAVLRVLWKVGCTIEEKDGRVRIISRGRPLPLKLLKTAPYPGFPTDMQSQMMSLLCIAEGVSVIEEKIFESRYQNVDELIKMGADIRVDKQKHMAEIHGVKKLTGSMVRAYDLRGGAAMVIAGLLAEGKTIIRDADYIERGYEDICRDVSGIGGKLENIRKQDTLNEQAAQ